MALSTFFFKYPVRYLMTVRVCSSSPTSSAYGLRARTSHIAWNASHLVTVLMNLLCMYCIIQLCTLIKFGVINNLNRTMDSLASSRS